MTARIVLLVTSPRLPAGLLTAAAWDTLRAHPVYTAAESPQAAALRASGVPVTVIDPNPETLLATLGITPSPTGAPTFMGVPITPISAAVPNFTGAPSAPSSTAVTPTPSSAGATSAPASAGATSAPSSAGATSAPSSAGATSAPSSAGATSAPASAGTDPAPTSAGAVPAPTAAGAADPLPPSPNISEISDDDSAVERGALADRREMAKLGEAAGRGGVAGRGEGVGLGEVVERGGVAGRGEGGGLGEVAGRGEVVGLGELAERGEFAGRGEVAGRGDVAEQRVVVWLAGPDGDESFARSLGLRLAREPGLAELELMYGSWDPPGARLLDAVAVMDQLVSPGGDPWKRQQNHQTLAQYLLEEAYEAYDTIEADDTDALREELGDVLLQILLHSRLAEEHPEDERWSIDDVAGGFVDKMIRRNPHVFAGEAVADIEEITANWERIKKAEKSRQSALDGIALSQPALALSAKILSRTRRAGLEVPLPTGDDVGSRLLRLVAESPDAEHLLRQAALAYADTVRARENVRPPE